MDNESSKPIQNDIRRATYDRIIGLAEDAMAKVPAPLVLDIRMISPTSARNTAEKECWGLIIAGLKHLKEGAPGGQAGSMTTALSKASLRSSSLAASLGVKPPKFEQLLFAVDYNDGFQEAQFYTTRLLEAARGDAVKSGQLIVHKISTEDVAATLMLGANITPGSEDISAIRKQMMFSFNFMSEAYNSICDHLKEAVSQLQPPVPPSSPKRKPRSYDL